MKEPALQISAVVTIIISFTIGVLSGSFFGFLIALFAGGALALVLFSIAELLSNQYKILAKLEVHHRFTRQIHKKVSTCRSCNYEFDHTYSSCPNCGNRQVS